MSRINIYGENGLEGWFDPATAERFHEAKEWNGRNRVGVVSGGQIGYEMLFRTKGGRWIHNRDFTNEFNGGDVYRFISDAEARDWLIGSQDNDEAVERYFGEIEEEKGPGRPEVGPAFSLRFPQELIDAVDERAKSMKISRAQLVRMYCEAGIAAISIEPLDPGREP